MSASYQIFELVLLAIVLSMALAILVLVVRSHRSDD
jgi:hypothetical protein